MLKLLTIGTLGSALVCGMAAAASAQTMPPPNPPNIRYILPGAADSYAAESSVLALSMADRTNGAIRAASPTTEPATELIPAWSATPAFADHALGLENLGAKSSPRSSTAALWVSRAGSDRRSQARSPASPARKFRSRRRLRTTSSPRDEFPAPNNRAARRRFGYVFAICNEYRFKKN